MPPFIYYVCGPAYSTRISDTVSLDQCSGEALKDISDVCQYLDTKYGKDIEQMVQKHVHIIELLFVFVEAVFVAPRSEELGIAT